MEKDLTISVVVLIISVVVMIISTMGIVAYNDIKMAEAGLQQCRIKADIGHSVVWQKTCQEPQETDNGSVQR